jgi:mono/diheme cytochrome c family protein
MFARATSRLLTILALAVPAASRATDPVKGKAVYAEHCVVCHGLHGKGNGPSGKALDPKPTDFTTATPDDESWFKGTKLGSKAIGKSDKMEGFAAKLSDDDIRDVVAYAKAFKAK